MSVDCEVSDRIAIIRFNRPTSLTRLTTKYGSACAATSIAASMADAKEGMAAFVEERAAKFTGT